jgi:hypothetical protein
VAAAGLWVYTRLAHDPPRPAGHDHRPSARGGTLVSLGDDAYHVEAVLVTDGTLALYTLGPDQTRVIDVPAEPLAAHVTPHGESAARAVELEPAPQPGDAPGRASRFIGRLPPECVGRAVTVTVPALRIDQQRFHVAIDLPGAGHGAPMPAKVVDAEERELYLTPGGKYTAADIEANGRLTASEKFRGFRAQHDFAPEPGDRVCPVTRTKADPRCAWLVGGKEYLFCCPPCVDEFVRLAKERPEEVRDPGEYVRQ